GTRPVPAPEPAAVPVTPAAPEPTGPRERIARIWQELLGVPEIGPHANFFELGGHSLLATQVLARIRDVLDVSLPPGALFEAPTIAQLAAMAQAAGATAEVAGAMPEVAGAMPAAGPDIDDPGIELSDILAEIQRLTPEQLRA